MKFSEKIKKIKKFLLDLLFPKTCLICLKEGFYLCPGCLEKIPLIDKFNCLGCGKISLYGLTCESCQRKIFLKGLICALNYQNPIINQAIKWLKYSYVREMVEPLSALLIKLIRNSHFLANNFSDSSSILIIPVPLHRQKFLWRGFNQSELLAQKIAQEFELELKNNLLIKIKNTRSQTDLKEEKRMLNVKDVFEVKNEARRPHCNRGFLQDLIFDRRRNPPKHTLLRSLSFGRVPPPHSFNNSHSELTAEESKKEVKDKIILLIDDVVTTGATLNEAAKALKKSGAKEVWGMAVARGKN